jgi:hypothetical protein
MKDLKKRVKELLENTPPQATKFANAIYSILKREKNWVRSNTNRNNNRSEFRIRANTMILVD